MKRIEDFSEGDRFFFVKTISKKDVDDFAALSGDTNPLHMDDAFACARGFAGRVVHGALLVSYISKLVGVHFPGEECLLQTLDTKFISPCYIGDTVEVKAEISHMSIAANAMVIGVNIENKAGGALLVRGKAQVTFTKAKDIR